MNSITSQFEVLLSEEINSLEEVLSSILDRMYKELGPGLGFIQFIDEKIERGMFGWIPPQLRIGQADLRIEHLLPKNKCLTRLVAEKDQIFIWKNDVEAEEHYFQANPQVTAEIVGPIHYKNKVTGVVLFDSIVYGKNYGEFKNLFEGYLNDIDREIIKIERLNNESYNRDELENIVRTCLKETASTRGYIAVKRWDGLLEYIKEPSEGDVFLELSPHEGLCGKVFREGNLLNPPDLMNEPEYIPSDEKIKSEIICPISCNGETIGVINLESEKTKWYRQEAEILVRQQALRAVEFANFYRRPADSQLVFALADLFQTTFWIRPPQSFKDFERDMFERLERWATKMLNGRKCQFWINKKNNPPHLLKGISWETCVEGGEYTTSESNRIIYTPLLDKGDPKFIIAVESEDKNNPHYLKTLKALCQLTSEGFQRGRYEYRSRAFSELIDFLLTNQENEISLIKAVESIPFILQSSQCTLFYRMTIDNKVFFIPGNSTSKLEDFIYKDSLPGYPLALDGGLTSYVATTGKKLNIRSVKDKKELERIDSHLKWAARISEEIIQDCRSFLAFPIMSMTATNEIIGVLRTHRDSNSRRSRFTKANETFFSVITNLLSGPLEIFLSKKS